MNCTPVCRLELMQLQSGSYNICIVNSMHTHMYVYLHDVLWVCCLAVKPVNKLPIAKWTSLTPRTTILKLPSLCYSTSHSPTQWVQTHLCTLIKLFHLFWASSGSCSMNRWLRHLYTYCKKLWRIKTLKLFCLTNVRVYAFAYLFTQGVKKFL